MTTLFPYQETGAQWLAKVGRGLLADDPGLGKSAQAISACDRLKVRPVRCVLVVCPASVVENWRREFKRFSTTGIEPIVISYNKAGSLQTMVPEGDHWDALILDEAHYLKTRDTKRTQAVFGKKCDGVGGLVEKAKHVFLLTGTPMPNAPNELWPMLRAVMPDAIKGLKTGKPVAYWPFAMRYCKMERNYLGHDVITGGKNLPELRERMKPFVLRRKKADVLKDLPPIRFDVLPLAAQEEVAELKELKRDELIQEVKERMERAKTDEARMAILRAVDDSLARRIRRLTGMAKTGLVAEWVRDQLSGGLQKIVLFAQHRDVIEDISSRIFKNYGVATIHGGTTDRQKQVDRFQNEPLVRVFVGQIQAAGTGITLTAASDMVFVESSYVPTENEQAAMRIYRIGQKNACTVRFATIAGSIDEQIQRACARKLEDIRALFV